MTKISRQEVLKLAHMSYIHIHEQEIQPLIEQLEQVLTYAARVQEVTMQASETSIKNVNVFREDVPVAQDAERIRSRAPEREGDYFVVPKILENN
jgi:aspartyl-tRNA(Asn)/glutamyl-tRNA(Gln) amidotransferase subunit C